MLWKLCFRLLVLTLGLWLILDLVSRLGAEIFWFQEVGYLQVLLLRLKTQGVLWAIAFGITASYLVVYENRIVMAQTLEQALQAIFQSEETTAPPIVRPVEEPAQ